MMKDIIGNEINYFPILNVILKIEFEFMTSIEIQNTIVEHLN